MVPNSLYNEDIKLEFLSYTTPQSKNSYARIFKKSKTIERELSKDIYNFSGQEIRRLFSQLRPISKNASKLNGQKVKTYIEWAIQEGYRDIEFNPIGELESPSWYDQFIVNQKQYISLIELEQIEALCKNYQDRVIFRLLFEGVHGKGCTELLYLTRDDLNKEKNILFLKNEDGSIRELKVSSVCIEIIEEALKEKIYYKKNGDMQKTNIDNVRDYSDLVQNGCVIRNCIGNTDNISFINKHTIYRRIATIQEYITKYKPELAEALTAKSITRSGMIYEGKKRYERNGVLKKEDYDSIAQRYNVKNPWLIREFVNEEMIKALYKS